ncbi:MAG: DPP IV N-terminal domain-containing protein [Chloroflexi bacterium]|nr:DPP IV N-terminal domain-containing protein [Chloroflexota bacterium]
MDQIGRRTVTSLSVGLVAIVILLVTIGQQPSAGQVANNKPNQAQAQVSGILFLRNPAQQAELWRSDANGQGQQLLVPQVSDYSLSPDGRKVAYATQAEAQPSRIEMFDLTQNQVITSTGSADWTGYTPNWSPADGVIVYERRTISTGGVGSPKLWLMQPDGTQVSPVVKGGDVVTFGAHWSNAGRLLGFTDPLRNELVLFDFSDVLRRIPFSGDFDWSPDDQRLVISVLRESQAGFRNELILFDLATEQQTPLTSQTDTDDFTPVWSPDGTKIAFVRRTREVPRGEIWVVNADGSEPRAITAGGGYDNVDPQWTPDSQQLLWTRLTVGSANVPSAIWTVNLAEKSEPRVLIENATQARWIVE